MSTPKKNRHDTGKVCPTCMGAGKLWCAACGEWGDHSSGTCPLIEHPERAFSDTERLDFLLKYFRIDDVGDEDYCPGICVSQEDIEEDLSFGKENKGKRKNLIVNPEGNGLKNLREVIDSAIREHSK